MSDKRREVIAGLADLGRRLTSPAAVSEGDPVRIEFTDGTAFDGVVSEVAADGTLTLVRADAWQPGETAWQWLESAAGRTDG